MGFSCFIHVFSMVFFFIPRLSRSRSFCTKACAPKSAAEEEREEEPKEGDEGGELWVNDHKFTGIMVYHD